LDGIITNYPDLARKVVDDYERARQFSR
jgi:hypothetical protein